MKERIESQVLFIGEIDRLKWVLRRNLITDKSRRENSAEHSWHLGLMAVLLAEHSEEKLDLLRLMKMVLIHDLVEIDAGDAFCYDPDAQEGKETREQAAAKRIFGMLPLDQQQELSELWRDFEDGITPEAKFARALDRLQPTILHDLTDGDVWREHHVTKDQFLKRVTEIKDHVPRLWPIVEEAMNRGVVTGALKS